MLLAQGISHYFRIQNACAHIYSRVCVCHLKYKYLKRNSNKIEIEIRAAGGVRKHVDLKYGKWNWSGFGRALPQSGVSMCVVAESIYIYIIYDASCKVYQLDSIEIATIIYLHFILLRRRLKISERIRSPIIAS